MTELEAKYSVTFKRIQCEHCAIEAPMKIICEGEETHFDFGEYGNDDSYDDTYYKWQILKCLVCSEVNVFEYSSSSVWEHPDPHDGEKSIRPIYKDVLYPHLVKEIQEKPLELKISSEVIKRTIADLKTLISSRGAVSGVDRVHTLLHGYMRAICIRENITYQQGDNITKLFKLLRQHPKLNQIQNSERLLQSFSSIVDSLNPIRNDASMAHPNENILEEEEAWLVITVVRTLIYYLDKKFY